MMPLQSRWKICWMYILTAVQSGLFKTSCCASEHDLFFGNGISHLFSGGANGGKALNPTGPFYCPSPASQKRSKDYISWDMSGVLLNEHKSSVSFCSRLSADATRVFKFDIFRGASESCGKSRSPLPEDLCDILLNDNITEKTEMEVSTTQLKAYADELVDNSLLDVTSSDPNVNSHIGYGGMLARLGRIIEARDYFKMISEEFPDEAAVLYMKGMILLQETLHLETISEATSYFKKCSSLDPAKWECLEKEAEMLFGEGEYLTALDLLDQALLLNTSSRLYFLKGTLEFHAGDLVNAETSFKTCARLGNYKKTETQFCLATVLFHRGKLRTAVETYRDILRENKTHVQAALSVAQVYYELGNYPHALRAINSFISMYNTSIRGLQLQAMLYYYSGQPHLAQKPLETCLELSPMNQACLYLSGLSHLAQGRLYPAVKAHSKTIVYSKHPALKASTEFQRAHYLREYARYLHWKLELPFEQFSLDSDLCSDFKSGWSRAEVWEKYTNNCMKQKELVIDIPDVDRPELSSFSPEVQKMLCFAKKLGQTTEINSDGFLTNKRSLMAAGIGALHIAQKLSLVWKQINKSSKKSMTHIKWEEIYQVAVKYQQLVDPELPTLWHAHMPQYKEANSAFKTDIHFLNGYTINVRLAPYFDLVFRLVRSMIDNYSGEGIISSDNFREDIQNIESFDDLIQVIKQNKLKEQGFVIATQVPSLREPEAERYQGVMIMLTGASEGRVEFAVNHVFSEVRNEALSGEIQALLGDLTQQVHKRGACCLEHDRLMNTLLSIVYYLYNLMPLSRGSSLATYTVLAGILLSLGREITGRLPPGKQPEMEAILSGAPDAFAAVTEQWYNVQRLNGSVSDHPLVWEQLPTLRSVMRALNVISFSC